jgi:hypothetical protein
MGVLDLLNRYSDVTPGTSLPDAEDHFEQIAREAPPEEVADGLAHAFRAEETPPFESMVGQLFGRSDPQQRAGMLGQLLQGLSPAILGSVAAGPLGSLLRGNRRSSIRPEETRAIDPRDVQEVARQAERANPSIVERMSSFYAQHPQLVRNLGSAALSIAMRQMARRRMA